GELRKHFRPEFLNRVDETIVFHALTEKDLMRIVEIQLGRLRERLADRKITLVLTDAAKKHVVQVGYDPNYGARPLKRTLQKEIETGLAKRMLKGDIPDGSTVTVDYNPSHDGLTFRV
ncbi:MAG: type VI secretion system ATPase TssH, partial [Gemmataceae bacterium]